ncbi:hypothetical protein ABZP36_015723 [Zizania latifolia]
MISACPRVIASRHPSEQELITSYLQPRAASSSSSSGDKAASCCSFIYEADVYSDDPARLTTRFPPACSGDAEEVWYFFSPARTKTARGQRRARTVDSGEGCWHSEAGVKAVLDGGQRRIGYRQFFSFMKKDGDKRPVRTGWLMVELGLDRKQQDKTEHSVLCKIYFTKRTPASPVGVRRSAVELSGLKRNAAGELITPSTPPSEETFSHRRGGTCEASGESIDVSAVAPGRDNARDEPRARPETSSVGDRSGGAEEEEEEDGTTSASIDDPNHDHDPVPMVDAASRDAMDADPDPDTAHVGTHHVTTDDDMDEDNARASSPELPRQEDDSVLAAADDNGRRHGSTAEFPEDDSMSGAPEHDDTHGGGSRLICPQESPVVVAAEPTAVLQRDDETPAGHLRRDRLLALLFDREEERQTLPDHLAKYYKSVAVASGKHGGTALYRCARPSASQSGNTISNANCKGHVTLTFCTCDCCLQPEDDLLP